MKYSVLLFVAALAGAQTHPRILINASNIGALRALAATPTPEWTALKGQCDAYIGGSVRPPKTTTGRYNFYTLDYGYENSVNPNIGPGFQGGGGGTINGYWDAALNLGVCYQMTISGPAQDLAAAANYAAKVKEIAAQLTLRPASMVINDGAKAGKSRYIYDSSFVTGTAWNSGTVVVNGTVSAGASSVTLRGMTPSGTIAPGDVFVVDNNAYIVSASTSADGSGNATVALGTSHVRAPVVNRYNAAAMTDGTAVTTPFVVLSNRHIIPADGTSITISGVTGNTGVNGTWTVNRAGGTYGSHLILLGSDARGGTLQTQLPADALYNGGYGARFYGTAMALIYDWLFAELSSTEKTDLADAMVRWGQEAERNGYGQRHVAGNYYAGQSTAKIFAALAIEQEDARGVTMYNEWLSNEWDTTARQYPLEDGVFNCPTGTECTGILQYFNNRLLNTFHPDGSNYGWLATQNYLWVAMALKTSGKFDPSVSPYSFTWHESVAKAIIHGAKPNRTTNDTRTKTFTGTDPARVSGDALFTVSGALRAFSSAFADEFQHYVNTTKPLLDAIGVTDPRAPYHGRMMWNTFLFYDSTATAGDYTTEPLSFVETGSGNWHARSSWNTDAVSVDFVGGPNVHSIEGGKDTRDRGGITISRGDPSYSDNKLVRVVTNAYYELTKGGQGNYADNYTINDVPGTPGIQNILFVNSGQRWMQWLYGPGDFRAACNQVTTTSLSRSVEGSSFAYARSANLQDSYYPVGYYTAYPGQSSICGGTKPMTGWTREVLYLRPKLTLIYDRVRGIGNNAWDRYVNFGFVPTPVLSGTPPTGMTRYDITASGSKFIGSIFGIKPDGHGTTLVNRGGFGLAYMVEYRPAAAAADHNFFFAVDAADALGSVYTLVKQSGTNADAVQVSETNTVAAFVTDDTPTLPLSYNFDSTNATQHHVVGLAASTAYGISASSSAVTISTGGADGSTDAAGVLTFAIPSGGGGATGSIQLAASPSSLIFACEEGGSNPSNQTVALTGIGGTAAVTPTDGAAWTTLTLSGGSAPQDTPQTLTVAVDCTGLVAASSPYSASISVASATSGVTNSPITIGVTLNVTNVPVLSLDTASLSFTGSATGSIPTQTVTATLSSAADLSVSDDAAWLSVSPTTATGVTSQALVVTADPTSLSAGTYTATITITSAGSGGSPATVGVTLEVTASAPLGIAVTGSLALTVGASPSVTLAGSGGTSPYAYFVEGALPSGVTLATDALAGTVSGIGIGDYAVNFCVEDSFGAVSRVCSPALITVAATSGGAPSVTAAGDAVVDLRPSSGWLDASSGCDVLVRNSGGTVVWTGSTELSQGVRLLPITGLAAGTYTATMQCGLTVGGTTSSFTLTSASGTTPIVVQSTLPTGSGATGFTLDYGTTSAMGSTAAASCSGSVCTASATVAAGRALYWRVRWTGSAPLPPAPDPSVMLVR